MCIKAADTSPECYEAQKMFHKIVYICPFLFNYASDQHRSQKRCDEVISEYPFLLKYCPVKTWEMLNKTVDVCLLALKFVHDWFVTSKMLEALSKVIFCNNDT